MAAVPRSRPDLPLALVLSGGNALGAYQAGAYEALHEAEWFPGWIAGASAGAINGALIAGNAPEARVARLREFWHPESGDAVTAPFDFAEAQRRTGAAALTMAAGRPGLFAPRMLYGPWWNPFGNTEPASLYDAQPLRATIERLVDFQRLNGGTPRFSATAIDVESGDEMVFDTATHALGPDHIRASSALLPVFSPVELNGRLLADAGLSANLPIDLVLSEPSDSPLLCIAIDLLPLRGPRPADLGETIVRMQDILFAAQSRRAIAAWQAIFDARVSAGDRRSVVLLHLAYSDHRHEVSGKAFDFSPRSAQMRWAAGYEDMSAALRAMDPPGELAGIAGLHVFGARKHDGSITVEQVRHDLRPHSMPGGLPA